MAYLQLQIDQAEASQNRDLQKWLQNQQNELMREQMELGNQVPGAIGIQKGMDAAIAQDGKGGSASKPLEVGGVTYTRDSTGAWYTGDASIGYTKVTNADLIDKLRDKMSITWGDLWGGG